jgi:hypothetical protein
LLCESLFGYSIEEFKNHIKSQPGYSVGGNWVVDHLFPVWAFIEAGVKNPKLINSLENLKVVPKKTNSKKCYKLNAVAFVRWLSNKGAI